MLNLSPIKLLIVLIVALLVAGPDRLPQIAKQLGGAWKALRTFTTRIETEVRSNVPDLPSSGDIARFARSPIALLDKLAGLDEKGLQPDHASELATEGVDGLVPDPGAPPTVEPAPQRPAPPALPASGFDPSLN